MYIVWPSILSLIITKPIHKTKAAKKFYRRNSYNLIFSTSCKLEPVIWWRGTGQWITWFDRCQLIITWCHISKNYKVNQDCMSLSTYYLGRAAILCDFSATMPTCPRAIYCTASHDNHKKINSWVSFSFLYKYGAPSSAKVSCRQVQS